MIECSHISFSYPSRPILSNFSHCFTPGITAIAGTNGSGKTTLLKLLTGLALPNAGEVKVDGFDTRRQWESVRQAIGIAMYSERAYNFRLSGYHNAEYLGALNGFTATEMRAKEEKLFSHFDGSAFFSPRYGELSLGQRSIFSVLLAALLAESTIIADEPTSALDSRNSKTMYRMLQSFAHDGFTVVVTTHDKGLIDQADSILNSGGFMR